MILLNNKKRFFMSAGILVDTHDDGTYDIQVFNREKKAITITVSLPGYLVWDAAKGGIIDTEEFVHHAKKNLLSACDKNDIPNEETILNTIEKHGIDLIENGLLTYEDCASKANPAVVMTQVAMHGLYLPLIKGNETLIMAKPTGKLLELVTENSVKANLLSSSRKKILKWLDDGKTIFDLALTAFHSRENLSISEKIGKDLDYLLSNGYVVNYGWYITPALEVVPTI